MAYFSSYYPDIEATRQDIQSRIHMLEDRLSLVRPLSYRSGQISPTIYSARRYNWTSIISTGCWRTLSNRRRNCMGR